MSEIVKDYGERSINIVGASSMMILPKQWMRDNGLNLKSVKVNQDKEGRLIISPGNKRRNVDEEKN